MAHTVAHFLDSSTYGGCEEVILTLLGGLDKERWRPLLFHHDSPGIARLLREVKNLGIDCRAVPSTMGQSRTMVMWKLLVELRAVRPKIVHVHLNWPLACRHALIAARLSRVPGIVATAHIYGAVSSERWAWLKRRVHSAAVDRYVAVSTEIGELFCKELRLPRSKVRVVHNGIRLADFERSFDHAMHGNSERGIALPIVFTPARLHRQKGHEYLLHAATMVPNATFLLAGDGPERERLHRLASELRLLERVKFLGQREDVPQLLRDCDVFVPPSLYEGLPLTVLEAMAACKPVVATAIGGTKEAVIHGKTGILVPPGDANALASGIRTVLEDHNYATRLANAGSARVKQLFSSERMVAGVTDIYEELISNSLSASSGANGVMK